MSVAGMVKNEERPSYVKFERVPVENTAASKAAGHYVAIDVDYANITSPGSKDVFKIKVSQWFLNMAQDVAQGRMPEKWAEDYKEAYKRWQNNQEIPLNGTPILGWGVISPAQQKTLIEMSIKTVEDLAALNDEGIRRIGMGAVDLQHKATAWLAQLQDKGPLTVEVASLKSENEMLKGAVATLQRQVGELTQMVRAQPNAPGFAIEAPEGITANDILEDEPSADDVARYTAKFGQPPHHRMKPETIAQKLRE